MNLYEQIFERAKKGKKSIAILLDPDKVDEKTLDQTLVAFQAIGVDYFFVGGSLLMSSSFNEKVDLIKSKSDIPIILFPGSAMQISDKADAILLLSLISGRNPELLIGQHVLAAPSLKKSSLEIIPTGYLLIDGGKSTTAHYISQTLPIPMDKPEIASCTAMAGEMLGLKLMYLDGGSGAKLPVSQQMISEVKRNTSVPLVVGGGIKNKTSVDKAFQAGADIVVIGNSLEKNPELLAEFFESEYLT
ncbi:MAG: phosphoglycerol geranylgeranyltransferase [Patiriisocius sp.]